MGGGNNAGMRVAAGRYFFLLNSDAWVVGDGLERLVAYADAHPEAAVVGPRLRNTDGTLQRSVRGEPTLWRLATEYLFIRKLAPRSRLLNPLYVGGFAHDEEVEADWLYGPALLVRREAVDAVGHVRRGVLHVQRRGRLDDAVPAGRVEGAVLSRRRGRARRRRVARRADVRREPAQPPALLREARRPEDGRARTRPAALVAAPARARPAPRAPTARESASSRPATPSTLLR